MLVGIGAVIPNPGCVHRKGPRTRTVKQPSVQMLHRDRKRSGLGTPGVRPGLDLLNPLIEFPKGIESATTKPLRLAVEVQGPGRMPARLCNIPARRYRGYITIFLRLLYLGEIELRLIPLAHLKVRMT